MSEASMDALERAVIRKIAVRLLPIAMLSFFLAYVDRTNISIAAITMNRDLGFSAYVYGIGAGIFFIGYLLFEIPSNLIMVRTGARIWIGRIMLTWAVVSGLTAFVNGPASFYAARFMLGVAEAGLLPGLVLYFTYWFPSRYRARVFAALYFAQPVANAVGGIASSAILSLDGVFGLHGWQWIFLIEAIPPIALALVILRSMPDRPADAAWLAESEKIWLQTSLAAEARDGGSQPQRHWIAACLDRRVLALALLWFSTVTANYGVVFFLPQIIEGLHVSQMMLGTLYAIPSIVGVFGLILWGWSSDRMNERRWHAVTACALGAVGLFAAGFIVGSWWALAAMSVAMIGLFGIRAVFWAIPSSFLSGREAAVAFAFINATAQLGGYMGPFCVGWIKSQTGSFESGLYVLAGWSLLSALIAIFAGRANGGTSVEIRDKAFDDSRRSGLPETDDVSVRYGRA
ncbi:MFS transporter [Luteimonas panaciterrae]|uniref:MFS transporter n=1 Tax=Luteimonas panaciterrae TaxID=363885 RepID=UPI001CFA6036|nr:MFS transporter [Luteimonas panaciterrae]